MQNKKWTACLLACLCAYIANAGVIAAWDINSSSSTESEGWTTFAYENSLSNTVHFTGNECLGDGRITLTQTSATDTGRNKTLVVVTNATPALLTAGTDVLEDSQDIKNIESQTYTLSGLTEGQTYRLQFIGMLQYKPKRNLNLTVGSSTANLFTDETALLVAKNEWVGGFSECLTFTADATGRADLIFNEAGAGQKGIAGLIVETIPNPDGTSLIAETALVSTGTNLVAETAAVPTPTEMPTETELIEEQTGPDSTQPVSQRTRRTSWGTSRVRTRPSH